MKVPAGLSPEILTKLAALAEKATPGPWRECRDEVLIGGEWARLCRPEDAAYVAAASPEVVIALIHRETACSFEGCQRTRHQPSQFCFKHSIHGRSSCSTDCGGVMRHPGSCDPVIEALSPPLPSTPAPAQPQAQRERSIAEELQEIRNDLRPISPCLADRVEAVARKLAGGP